MGLAERKAQLRAAMAQRRRALDPAAAAAAARAVAVRIEGAGLLGSCRRLALYAAVRGELSCDPLVAVARARGVSLAFPRLRGAALEFALCEPESLEPAAFGVPAPPATLRGVTLAADDIVVAPALAFDAAGGRLGHGGGHYDRAFADDGPASAPLRVCVGYDFQRISEVPVGPHDQRVQWLVTEAGVWQAAEGESGIGERGAR